MRPTQAIRDIHWAEDEPREQAQDKCMEYFVGPERISQWIDCILDAGSVQFGNTIYHQSSGIFMGTSPAPDLANIFAFMHEFDF